MNQTRNLIIIIMIAALVLLAAVLATRKRNPQPAVSDQTALALGDTFFPDLPSRVDEITRIKLTDPQTSTTLMLGDEGLWNIDKGAGYPADQTDVKRLLTQLMDLTVYDAITNRTDRYENFGLDSTLPHGGSIALLNSQDQTIGGVLRGQSRNNENTSPMSSDGGLYMRRLGKDDPWVYLANNTFGFYSADTIEWINRSIPIYESTEKVTAINIQHATTSTVTIERMDSKWELTAPIPEGTQARVSAINSLPNALSRVNIEGVIPAENKSMDIASTFTAMLVNRSLYHAALSRDGSTNYLRLSADFIDEKGLEPATETLVTRKSVEDFNQRHSPWIYKVSDFTSNRLSKTFGELIEPVPQNEGDEK